MNITTTPQRVSLISQTEMISSRALSHHSILIPPKYVVSVISQMVRLRFSYDKKNMLILFTVLPSVFRTRIHVKHSINIYSIKCMFFSLLRLLNIYLLFIMGVVKITTNLILWSWGFSISRTFRTMLLESHKGQWYKRHEERNRTESFSAHRAGRETDGFVNGKGK